MWSTAHTVVTLGSMLTFCIAPAAQQPDTRPDYRAAIDKWLASSHDDAVILENAVTSTLGGGNAALRHLGGIAKTSIPRDDDPRRDAVQLLVRDVCLGFLDRESSSGMFYAGQFDPLDELQPYSGRLFLQLVVATPDWFPDNLRTSVVPVIRDLYPKSPGTTALGDLRAIAIDEVHEPAGLRFALACAFAQWGDRKLVQPQLDELVADSGDEETADELHFVRRVAFLHYQIRDYRAAAKVWLRYLRNSERLDSRPPPLDYYNAACSLSLAGRIPDALTEIETCGALLRSSDIDESHRIERRLFDEDPELRAIRPTRRFRAVVQATFGDDER